MTRSRRAAHGNRIEPLPDFLRAETAGGIVLFVATLAALVWANGPGAETYQRLWQIRVTAPLGPLARTEDLRHWMNEGLMALFFFVVGLEIKRELVIGELSSTRKAALPVIAAFAGVVTPAAIFLAIVGGGPAARGWGIPIATDIAFAVGVLALSRRVCGGVKLFLLSVAVVDDVIAIMVIALFYSAPIAWGWLAIGTAGLVLVTIMRRLGVHAVWPYVPVGLIVWLATHESGVHATIAGVALALLVPARPFRGRDVLGELEHRLHPVSAFVVIPLFAVANAGVDLRGGVLADAMGSSLTWAVVVGLFAGKIIGISGATVLAVRTGLARTPDGMRLGDVWGVAALAGIGFTVSLFIAGLAFDSVHLIGQAKVGIFIGSLASAVIGTALLSVRCRPAGRH